MSCLKDWSSLNIGDSKTKEEFDSLMEQYEEMICDAGYNLPEATPYFLYRLPKDARILDLCCGTGLVGENLIKQGYENISGIDFSNNIRIAQKKGYKETWQINLNSIKSYEIDFGFYEVIFMVGSLTYFKDKELQLIENIIDTFDFTKFIFSHRMDLITCDFLPALERLFSDVDVIENAPYLPGSEHYKNININWYICTK